MQRSEKQQWCGNCSYWRLSSFCGAYVEDVGEDERVRDKDVEIGCNDVSAHTVKKVPGRWCRYLCRRAGREGGCHRRNGWWMFQTLEGQSQHAFSVSHGTRKCHQVGTKYKAGTYFRGHNNIIQVIADGHIVIIGHWYQHIDLRNTTTTKQKK